MFTSLTPLEESSILGNRGTFRLKSSLPYVRKTPILSTPNVKKEITVSPLSKNFNAPINGINSLSAVATQQKSSIFVELSLTLL